jgi:hypothetical protein
MTHDVRKICPLCAWRANCVKRFSRGNDSTLHCPDFSEDVLLRKQLKESGASAIDDETSG